MNNVSRGAHYASVPPVTDAPPRGSAAGSAPGTLPAAVLWDMDGTIIDTEPQWLAAEVALAHRHGGTWTEEMGDKLIGMALPESIEIFRDLAGLTAPPGQLIGELVEEMVRLVRSGAADWRPGARELLTDLTRAQVPCALVTMSYQSLADVVLDMLPKSTFEVVVTGDQVSRGKPHPEPYLRAAERLGVRIEDTVALEDSLPGVTSAAAAGAHTIAIPAHQGIPSSPDYALVASLAGLDSRGLLPLAARRG